MGLKDFVVEFDRSDRSYFAGQSVSGKVILEIRQEKRIEALQLTYFGNGNVQWKAFSAGEAKNNNNNNNATPHRKTPQKGSRNNRSTKSQYPRMVSAEEIYLNGKIVLLEKQQEHTEVILLPGKHEYSFEFNIPTAAPSTFLGPYGHVKYFVTATLKRQNSKRSHEVKIPFTVNGVLDLNTVATLTKINGETTLVSSSSPKSTCDQSIQTKPLNRNPQQQQSQNLNQSQTQRRQSDYSVGEVRKFSGGSGDGGSFTPCLCFSKPVGFSLRIPRECNAFVPGEYIQFTAEMKNMGKVDVSTVTLSLIQETKYYAEDETKTGQKIVIGSVKGPPVSSGECEIWETNESDCLFLEIPSIPPTNLATCNIIGVEYFLQLEMENYGKRNIKGQLPILIGTIPLKSTFKSFVPPKPSKESSEFGKPTKPLSEIFRYPGLVSPSFQEAKTYSLSSTTSANGLPSNANFIKPPGKHLNHFCSNNGNAIKGKDGLKDADSDDEFHEGRKHNEDLDLNFIPLYAKYISVYGED